MDAVRAEEAIGYRGANERVALENSLITIAAENADDLGVGGASSKIDDVASE